MNFIANAGWVQESHAGQGPRNWCLLSHRGPCQPVEQRNFSESLAGTDEIEDGTSAVGGGYTVPLTTANKLVPGSPLENRATPR